MWAKSVPRHFTQRRRFATKNEALRAHFIKAAGAEETHHLAWTEQRLKELGERTSLLNPLWYAGAFGIGPAGRTTG
jgi:ubiquinone biosynthesis monooxygenase Coq7